QMAVLAALLVSGPSHRNFLHPTQPDLSIPCWSRGCCRSCEKSLPLAIEVRLAAKPGRASLTALARALPMAIARIGWSFLHGCHGATERTGCLSPWQCRRRHGAKPQHSADAAAEIDSSAKRAGDRFRRGASLLSVCAAQALAFTCGSICGHRRWRPHAGAIHWSDVA